MIIIGIALLAPPRGIEKTTESDGEKSVQAERHFSWNSSATSDGAYILLHSLATQDVTELKPGDADAILRNYKARAAALLSAPQQIESDEK